MFDYRIDTFLMAAKTLNFTTAAKLLHITQPAVSMHIHQLEKEYQTTFFEQKGKQLYLTENGKMLFQIASRMKNDDHHMRQHFLKQETITELNFGTTLTISDYCISSSLKRLWKKYPHLHLRLIVGNTATLLDKINQGILDFAIVEGYFSKELYDSIDFETQEYIPICHPQHCFQREAGCLHDLADEPLLIREEGSGTREFLERILSFNAMTLQDFQNVGEIGSLNTLKQCVMADMGISFVYRPVAAKEIAAGKLRQIMIREKFYHTFSCVWSKTSMFAKQYQGIAQDLLKNE